MATTPEQIQRRIDELRARIPRRSPFQRVRKREARRRSRERNAEIAAARSEIARLEQQLASQTAFARMQEKKTLAEREAEAGAFRRDVILRRQAQRVAFGRTGFTSAVEAAQENPFLSPFASMLNA